MIERLLKAGLNFSLYRLPRENEVKSSISSKILFIPKEDPRLLTLPGFAIYPFDCSSEYIIVIPAEEAQIIEDKYFEERNVNYCFNAIPRDTTESEHAENVEFIVDWLRSREGPETAHEKVVLSRVKTHSTSRSLDDIFNSLLAEYKDMFVFCFNTSATGFWMGATPEKLVECDGKRVSAMSLAGTRPAGTSEQWDLKNREEQEIVTHYIMNAFEKAGLHPSIDGPKTKKAGPVEHLCSMVSAPLYTLTDLEITANRVEAYTAQPGAKRDKELGNKFPNGADNAGHSGCLNDLVFGLTPTPALSGFPKEEALKLITRLENHERGCYGGFCGPIDPSGKFKFFVNIRSMCIDTASETRCILITGGGITARSNAKDEWEETSRKASTLLRFLR